MISKILFGVFFCGLAFGGGLSEIDKVRYLKLRFSAEGAFSDTVRSELKKDLKDGFFRKLFEGRSCALQLTRLEGKEAERATAYLSRDGQKFSDLEAQYVIILVPALNTPKDSLERLMSRVSQASEKSNADRKVFLLHLLRYFVATLSSDRDPDPAILETDLGRMAFHSLVSYYTGDRVSSETMRKAREEASELLTAHEKGKISQLEFLKKITRTKFFVLGFLPDNVVKLNDFIAQALAARDEPLMKELVRLLKTAVIAHSNPNAQGSQWAMQQSWRRLFGE